MSKKLSPKKIKGLYKDLLMHAKKVRHYRKDLLSEPVNAELDTYVERLQAVGKGKTDVPESSAAETEIEKIHNFLVKHGGKIYPRTNLIEFAEMVLIAALVIIGIRTFFLQAFIIPTNSMYPTYNGMLTHVHAVGEAADVPSLPEKAFRLVTRGARNKSVTAEVSGDVYIPILGRDGNGRPVPYFQPVEGKNWGVLSAQKRRYFFMVGDTLQSIDLPGEYDAQDAYAPFFEGLDRNPKRVAQLGGVPFFKTTLSVQAGDPILNFDILLGDALFVDRISYHFIKPKVGDPFVFRTEEIPSLTQDQHYIKRIVGEGSDELKIEHPILYRNGEPIEGVDAFAKNHEQDGEYEGYVSPGFDRDHPMPLRAGAKTTVPEDHFFAMGDNSDSSLDSRYWGSVPKKSVIGRAIFIYFPFTDHWGPAE